MRTAAQAVREHSLVPVVLAYFGCLWKRVEGTRYTRKAVLYYGNVRLGKDKKVQNMGNTMFFMHAYTFVCVLILSGKKSNVSGDCRKGKGQIRGSVKPLFIDISSCIVRFG